MRGALIFTAIVLACAAGSLYSVAWRHGEGLIAADSSASDQLSTPGALREEEPLVIAKLPGAGREPAPQATVDAAEESWYQYVDARGSIRFAQSLGEVPRELRARAMRMEMSVPIQKASTASPRRARPPRAAPPDPDQVWGGSSGEVIIYTATWCAACKRAMAHMDEAGVDYVNKDIEDDPGAQEEYLEKSGGRRGIPLIDVGGQIMQGYSKRGLDRLLASLG